MDFFDTQRQVTPTWMAQYGQNSNSYEILWLSWLPARLTKIWSKVKSLMSGQSFLHYKSMGKFFVAQGQVTPKPLVRSGPKSTLTKILGLSSLSASLMKLRSKMKWLLIGQHFPHYKSMGLSVAMATRVFIRPAPNHYAANPSPQWSYT